MSLIPDHMSSDKEDPSLDIIVETRPKTKRPPLYKVLLLNDDYTPMEFVVIVLERFFGMNHSQAFEIMLTVHKKGLAVVGVFSHEIAETKKKAVCIIFISLAWITSCTIHKFCFFNIYTFLLHSVRMK